MDQQTYDREKALYLYISGLERGDAEQMQAIFEQAQTDPVLEKMINETHKEYAEEFGELPEPTDDDIRNAISEIEEE